MTRTPVLISLAIALAVALGSTTAPAQQPTDALRRTAEAAWAERDYAKAAEAFTALTAAAPTDAESWYRLGYALHALGRFDEALPAHHKAAEFATDDQPTIRANATYNVACVFALKNDTKQAVDWLEQAVAAGMRNTDFMQHDSDLRSVQQDERFLALVAKVESTLKTVAIVVHQGVEMLDFAGPAEVFSSARAPGGGRYCRVILVAPKKEPLKVQNTAGKILPEYSIADCPEPDIVVVPGGGTQVLTGDPEFMTWIENIAPKADVMMSVCTGAFVLAKAGLLDGKQATTHHSALAALRRQYPDIDVLEGVRYADNGSVITAGGVAAGIDAALRVVERQFGKAAAEATARYMEYPWPR
jgi:putative intracellular protease/amidase